ncbi:unannotated protein [freshwater metagenome]|uniref:Unannotated protein n=1 Tax=freshwater metagenome TaxID=449393 RepID=A0A6J7ENV2_9ZZZZ|nr:hypothetical protein [Actinomycetota bacterium]
MTDRITLEPSAIERLIRSAALEDLREETTPDARERSLGQAETALNALCGLSDREGPDGVWDVLATLDRRRLLTFATFAVSELATTDFAREG